MTTPSVPSVPTVAGLALDAGHDFAKPTADEVVLLAGIGIEGDSHAGPTVQHVSRRKKDGDRPNLRQVHLVSAELHDEVRAAGFDIGYGEFGENVVTRGLELGSLPVGTTLALGADAIVVLTGLRDPCAQIDRYRPGLRAAVSFDPGEGPRLFRDGAMAMVVRGGTVRVGDVVAVGLPPEPHHPLRKV
ncbi:MAG: MOSC domain-containing protein [Acidimicrobiia bacterium]|nr:MOSC domain-containing protein [Acidimicrobiia bacterium]